MLKLLELFGGIGACSKALERIGIDYEIADYVEIDKYAVASYNAIHNTNFTPQDIREWDKDIDVDLIMHGSPCQDFSVAGKGAGGDEGSGTRSSLMYETIRIVNKLKPKYVIWENVKNLLSKKHKHNFDKYVITMNKLGYNSYYQVLNAKDYEIPQNRERVFTISIRQDIDKGYTFPEKQELKLKLKDMLENNVDEKYYISDKMMQYIISKDDKYKVNEQKLVINRDIACSKTTREGNTRADTTDYICDGLPENINIVDTMSRTSKIITHNITQKVKVRKYPVNIKKLKELLKNAKLEAKITSEEISKVLNIPRTQVEHYFRNDKSFAVPEPSIWIKLKQLLKIKTNEFDKSIMTFEERDGSYDKANRIYDEQGLAPTLTQQEEKILVKNNTRKGYLEAQEGDGIDIENINSKTRRGRVQKDMIQTLNTSDSKAVVIKDNRNLKEQLCDKLVESHTVVGGEIINHSYTNSKQRDTLDKYIESKDGIFPTMTTRPDILGVAENKNNLRIRKLTPKECWRLMGFNDEDFEKAEKVNSNSQLYKQAGNSIVVNVLERILENLLIKENEFEGQITFDMLGG